MTDTRPRPAEAAAARRRRGIGSLVVLVMVALLVLFVMALGHDRFSSQVLFGTKKDTDGAVAQLLAESAIEESRFELARRANVPGDEVHDFFMGGLSARQLPDRVLAVNRLETGRIHRLLQEERYRRFRLEDSLVDVRILSQSPFERSSFETRGLLRYRAIVTAYPLLRQADPIVRDVEVTQEFKVAVLGPPVPFDRMTLYVHDGAGFLGLGRGTPEDPWPSANGTVSLARRDLARIEDLKREFDKAMEAFKAAASPILPAAIVEDLQRRVHAVPTGALEKVRQYESQYAPLTFGFPEPETIVLCLAAAARELRLEEVGPPSWLAYEVRWKALKDKSDRGVDALKSGQIQDPERVKGVLADLTALAELDQKLLLEVFAPPWFSGCKTTGVPRLMSAIAPETPAPGGDAIVYYRSLLDRLSPDRPGFRSKAFYNVRPAAGQTATRAFEEFRDEMVPQGRPLNGIVAVDNAQADPLALTGPFRGRLVLIASGDVTVSDIPAPDEQSTLTVICFGKLAVAGEVHAALFSRGTLELSEVQGGPRIVGSLIAEKLAGTSGLRGTIVPDRRLVASEEPPGGKVRVFPDHQAVVLSPTLDSRVVRRAGS